MEPTTTNLVQLRDAIASKDVSAVDVVHAYLDRAAAHNASLNAYHELLDEHALERAKQVDAGNITGPLAGVPIAIKDNMCTTFGRTTCSSRILENFRSPYTATAVRRLEDAGAIVIGKTNMDEFAMGSSSEHSAWGVVHNPWNDSVVCGGSSGGSASAVAADLCAGALGSDTGGSIRQPASFCGITGLKPTYGRVSRYGLVAFASSLDQIGPMTHTVADAAALLGAIAGHDPKDSTSAAIDVPDYSADLDTPVEGLRIGVAKQTVSDANSPAVAAAFENAINVYRDQGATIVDIDLPHSEYGVPTYYLVATAEASSNLARFDGVHYGHRTDKAEDLIDLYARSRAEGFGDEVKRRIMLGTYALSSGYYDAYYLRALKVRRLIKGDFDKAFEQCGAILCPAGTGPAFAIGAKTDDPVEMYLNDIYTVTANLVGIPGISVPAGESDGLPIGMQLFGQTFDEARLLRIARMFEAATNFHTARPTLATT